MTRDPSDDEHSKFINENLVVDPDRDELVNISTMDEKELVDLFDRSWARVKRFRTRHWERHCWIMMCQKILNKLYNINLHKWGRDEGRSGESLEAFKEYLTRLRKDKN